MKKEMQIQKELLIETKEAKLIEENEDYKIVEFYYPLGTLVIRLWYKGLTEYKFNEEYAKMNLYKNIDDFLNKIHPYAKEKLLKIYGRIPEWISTDLNSGKVWFPGLTETVEEFSDRLEQFLAEHKEQMIEEVGRLNPVKRMKVYEKLISEHNKNGQKTMTVKIKNLLNQIFGENPDAIKTDLD